MSGEAFATERLRENPDQDFASLQREAEQRGIAIQPIQYGRARRQLGLTGAAPANREPANVDPAVDPANGSSAAKEPAPAAVEAPKNAKKGPKPQGGFDFLVEALRAEPTLSYGELKARADELELKIAPIMYGRAKALLGLVPVRPRGQGKNRKAAEKPAVKPLKQVESVAADQFGKQLAEARSVDELVKVVKQLDGERRRLRALLEQIANSIDEALGYDD